MVRIGCYSAAWGDTALSAPQLLAGGNIKYLVGDLLAEVTMAILASKKMKNPESGFATDFVIMMAQNLKEIKRQGVKVCVNAGGINPEACRDAVLEHCKKQGIDLKVGVVLGDDVSDRSEEFQENKVTEMFSGKPFPGFLLSSNAYLGAFPVAAALAEGCDVVITGRCVDSALVLGPLIHEFGWMPGDYDLLASGTLAGHLVECGAQCTGGLFTDYEAVGSWVNIGYPIVDVSKDGTFTVEKPPNTDGLISVGSVCEQMLYEIGDPGAYHVPDVACDFTQVQMKQVGENKVFVSHCRGQPPTDSYKCVGTYPNGVQWGPTFTIVGHDAAAKAKRLGATLLTRWRAILAAKKLGDFAETRVETIGAGQFFRQDTASREVFCRVIVRGDQKQIKAVSREWACAGVSMAQGICGGGGMPTPRPIVSCFLFRLPKKDLPAARVVVDGKTIEVPVALDGGFVSSASAKVQPVLAAAPEGQTVRVPLLQLCWARSGDKADYANIGLICRRPEYLPVLRYQVTPERVRELFAHNIKGHVERFDLPGSSSMNFLLYNALGGGGTSSLHSDPLAKTYGQVLLSLEVDVPAEWAAHNRFQPHSKL